MISKELYLLLCKYWAVERLKEEAQLKDSMEKLQEDFKKQDEKMKKFKLELEHPELFNNISPKEYGMNIIKHKHKKRK